MAKNVKYLSNKNLLVQFELSNAQDHMTDELAKMCMLLVERYAKKPNFSGYSYNEDMQAFALMQLVRTWRGFNKERSDNPFAWMTQCVKNSFIQVLNKEKAERDKRDAQLVDIGLNPSNTYAERDNEVESVRALDF